MLRRDLPNARKGKAQALNAAYHRIGALLPTAIASKVIVVVVDADGRIAPDAPRFAASHFADPEVGGVQALVRIYNRSGFLTRMQDVEFSVYGSVYQAGRNAIGTAGMGGNGQFNRLSALDDIVEDDGPWRNRLTEDQDLGLRLLAAGWKSHQELRAVVEQQGVPRLRPLLRQRTRWSQGNLQAFGLLGATWRSPFPRRARLGEVLYLLMPLWQTIVGAALVCAVALAVTGQAAHHPEPSSCSPSSTCSGSRTPCSGVSAPGTRRAGAAGCVPSASPTCTRSTRGCCSRCCCGLVARQLGSRRDWSRTDREPLESIPGARLTTVRPGRATVTAMALPRPGDGAASAVAVVALVVGLLCALPAAAADLPALPARLAEDAADRPHRRAGRRPRAARERALRVPLPVPRRRGEHRVRLEHVEPGRHLRHPLHRTSRVPRA